MRDDERLPFPLGLMALEFFGSLLMGLGFAKNFGGLDLLPTISQFDQSGWLMIGLGFLLTVPFLVYIMKKVQKKSGAK